MATPRSLPTQRKTHECSYIRFIYFARLLTDFEMEKIKDNKFLSLIYESEFKKNKDVWQMPEEIAIGIYDHNDGSSWIMFTPMVDEIYAVH